MPGTSHELEASLLNELPIKSFDAVRELVNFYPLDSLIKYVRFGVPDKLKQRYPRITDSEWVVLSKKICLTRLSALRITSYYPVETVQFLLDVATECLNCKGAAKIVVMSHLKPSQSVLTIWLAVCFKIIENNNNKINKNNC